MPQPRPSGPRSIFVQIASYRHSEGLGWARNRCNSLYAGEEYTLQVDAHTRFAPGWDEGFVEMHRSLPHGRSLLTTYPPGYTVEPDGTEVFDDATTPRRLELVEQRPDGAIMVVGVPVPDATEPGPSPYLGGCLVFGGGAFVVDVPHDPMMYFHGEELALAVRAFTHGYDFFHPHRNLVWHHYYHGARTHWDDRADHGERHRRAVARLRELLVGDPSILGDYGTGDRRTRESYFAIAGLHT